MLNVLIITLYGITVQNHSHLHLFLTLYCYNTTLSVRLMQATYFCMRWLPLLYPVPDHWRPCKHIHQNLLDTYTKCQATQIPCHIACGTDVQLEGACHCDTIPPSIWGLFLAPHGTQSEQALLHQYPQTQSTNITGTN